MSITSSKRTRPLVGTAAVLAVLVLAVSSAASTRAQEPTATATPVTPFDAIQGAANDPVHGVTGVFEFQVRGSGRDREFVYLNSEKDYRDQRCLTIRMTRGNAADLGRRLGMSVRQDLIGKRIRVHGTAKRERIIVSSSGRRTGIYYYQTHVYVADPEQVELVGAWQEPSPSF